MTFSYDNAGNMTSKGTFDGENRLVARNGMTYLYDGSDRRIRKQDGGTVVNYVYSFSGQLLVEDNITTESSESYIYFNGQMVAIQGDSQSSFKLLLKDRMGSTRRTYTVTVPGYAKTLNETYKYDPWGQIISSSQSTPPYTDIKYQGKERENDLDYFGARYYDALSIAGGSSMRWISADPLTYRIYDPQSLNKYSYVRNDPVNWIDPDGQEPCEYSQPGIPCYRVSYPPGPTNPFDHPEGNIGGGGAGPLIRRINRIDDGMGLLNLVDIDKIRIKPPAIVGLDKSQQKIFEKAFELMQRILSIKSCSDVFLGKGFDVLSTIKFQYASVAPIIMEDTSIGNVLLTPSQFIPLIYSSETKTVTLNTQGDFFTQEHKNLPGSLSLRTDLAGHQLRAMQLLHELGHATGVFEMDTYSSDAQIRNNNMVLKGCFPGHEIKQ